MCVNYDFSPFIYFEEILFSLAREKSAVHIVVAVDEAVENQNWHAALLSLDYIPYLSNLVSRPPGGRKWNWNGRSDLGQREKPPSERIPPSESGGADVLETPSGSESAHGPCAIHQTNSDHANDQPHHGERWKERK